MLLLLVRDLANRLEPGLGIASAIALGGATLLLPFANLYFSRVLAATLAFGAYALLHRERHGTPDLRRVALAGLLLGLGLVVEYPVGLAGAVLFVYAIARNDKLRRAFAFGVPAILGALPALAFNQWAFGSPFHFPYEGWTLGPDTKSYPGLFGLTIAGGSAPTRFCSGFAGRLPAVQRRVGRSVRRCVAGPALSRHGAAVPCRAARTGLARNPWSRARAARRDRRVSRRGDADLAARRGRHGGHPPAPYRGYVRSVLDFVGIGGGCGRPPLRARAALFGARRTRGRARASPRARCTGVRALPGGLGGDCLAGASSGRGRAVLDDRHALLAIAIAASAAIAWVYRRPWPQG